MNTGSKGTLLPFHESAVILVEGWSDNAVICLALELLGWNLIDKKEIKELGSYIFSNGEKKVQVNAVGGKERIRYRLIKLVSGFDNVDKILVIKDADEDRSRTEQSLRSFCDNFLNDRRQRGLSGFANYIILPPTEGKELEDYILEKFKFNPNHERNLSKLEACLKDLSLGADSNKFSKRLFYSFLLFSDSCSYEGTSLRGDILYSCLKNLSLRIPEIEEKLSDFLENV